MRLLELLVVGGLLLWVARLLRHAGKFDHAWLGLFLGVGMMLSRVCFVLGAILTCVSFGVLTLPLARAEWARVQGERARDGVGRSG